MSAEAEAKLASNFEPKAARLSWIIAAPHRLFFFLATLLLLIASTWWGVVLVLRLFGRTMPGAIAPTLVHGTTMLYTFVPMYMFGFLFTAGPAWLGVKGPGAPALLMTALFAFAGGVSLIALSIFS